MSAKKCPPDCSCGNHSRKVRKNRVPTTCLYCDKVTMRLPCFADRKFCNRDCSNKFNWSEDGGRTKLGDRICPTCNEAYHPNTDSQQYCSHGCGDEGRKNGARVWLTCERCDIEYWRHKKLSGGSRYCSDDCKKKARKERAAARRTTGDTRSWHMSANEYRERFISQGGVCAICRKPETFGTRGKINKLTKDHCHQTGAWRGLLCGKCNRALGLLGDDADILLQAVDYLKNGGVSFAPQTD